MSHNCHFVTCRPCQSQKPKARPQTGAEFLGASAKAFATSSSSRATNVNVEVFEEEDDEWTFCRRRWGLHVGG